jgi:AGZA family xanthine/uracil permease-like MFS transporter
LGYSCWAPSPASTSPITAIPAFAVVALMAVTFNIAGGFVLYPICKMVSGTASELKPGMWVLTGLSLLFFVF